MKAGLAFLLAASLFLASCSSRAQEDLPDASPERPPSSSQTQEASKTEQTTTPLDRSTPSTSPSLSSSSDSAASSAPSSGIASSVPSSSSTASSTPAPDPDPAVSGGTSQGTGAASDTAPASAAPADTVSSGTDESSSPSSQPAREDAAPSQASSEDTASQADEGGSSSGAAAPRARAAGGAADESLSEPGQEEDETEETAPNPGKKPAYNLSSKYFLSEVENEFVKILNEEREEAGLSRLKKDETLSKAARLRAAEQVKNSYFAHKRPDGRDWNTVLSEEFPCDFNRQGENLASASYEGGSLSHQTAQQWYDQWEASPSHYENMFRPEFTYIGVGIYYSYEDGSYSSIAATLFAAD